VKRSPLRPISDKRRASLPARRRCIQIVLARDKVCQFWPALELARDSLDTAHLAYAVGTKCWGPLDVHEPGHRSQGADPTDPNQCRAICRGHHDFVHQNPIVAKALTL